MVFTTLIFMGIQRSLNTSLCRSDLKRYADSVRVYGDDLIVPMDHVSTVVSTLEHFGARVGTDKSFWTGKFRESCGKEYFNGQDVSIVRVRQAFPTRRQDVEEVVSLVELRNRLYLSGYWATVKWLDGLLVKLLTRFPTIQPTSSLLGRVSFLAYRTEEYGAEKLHPRFQSPVVKGFVVEAKPPRDVLDGTGALLKCLLKLDKGDSIRDLIPCHPSSISVNGLRAVYGDYPVEKSIEVADKRHLERFGRAKSLNMKLGWRSPL